MTLPTAETPPTQKSPAWDVAHHLAALDAQGYTIIPDFLSQERLRQVREGLAPHLRSHSGRNNFEGFQTERVYTLVGRGKVFEDIAEDQRVVDLLDAMLMPGYLLTASQAICIYPGETAQPVHYDDSFYPIPRPRPSISFSTIVAVDAFTAENGGTEIIAGSHRWSDAQVAGSYNSRAADAPLRPELEHQLVPVEMPAGSCIFFHGTLMHRGGANRSQAPRLAFSNQYCEPWARTQENFYLGTPPELVRGMSPRVQTLLGYEIMPPFMGHVTASHPTKVLREDYVNVVMAGRSPSLRA
ncbi:MAG TPA: phytanoyl-CoA dioxygenase family protein [Burkholderiaceae bacterium]|nr:phytanoyl-CoA dioxygenase family protein [Burkholderiaceae bacterium]